MVITRGKKSTNQRRSDAVSETTNKSKANAVGGRARLIFISVTRMPGSFLRLRSRCFSLSIHPSACKRGCSRTLLFPGSRRLSGEILPRASHRQLAHRRNIAGALSMRGEFSAALSRVSRNSKEQRECWLRSWKSWKREGMKLVGEEGTVKRRPG